MSGKIELLKISQSKTEYGCKVDFDIKINSNPYTLWYKIHCRDIESIPERSDSFAVTFLPFAMLNNLDLCSEYPMSTELYHNITTEIIPQLYVCNKKISSKINLHIPCTSETYNSDWNATGVSLGVDSFATIHEFQEGHLNDDFKLTHLVHLKTGAQSGSKGYFDREYEDRVFASENTRVRNFCDKYNYNLITIESNLFEITCAEFTAAFATSSTTRNLGAIMLLQHRIKRYYYAASYNIDDFSTHLDKDMAHYEKWLIPLLSANVKFYSANNGMTRIEKTKYIAQFPDSYDSLHVCWYSGDNCSDCSKCVRTLVQLDILGELDKYKNSFDLDHYYANRKMYINRVAAMRRFDWTFAEAYNYMKEHGMKTPNIFIQYGVMFKRAVHLIIKKLFRK